MVMEGDRPLGGGHIMQSADGASQNCTSETYRLSVPRGRAAAGRLWPWAAAGAPAAGKDGSEANQEGTNRLAEGPSCPGLRKT